MPAQIFGIVNITEDSFSDGGNYLAPDRAIAHGLALFAAGAAAVDLGPASSHPDAKAVSADEEIRRLAPVIDALSARGIPLSIDSFLPATQRYALSRGVAFLNDIQGFPDPELYSELAGNPCRLIVMHAVQGRGIAKRLQTDSAALPGQIEQFFTQRIAALEAAGIARNRLILDPGMGFFLGDHPQASLTVLRGIRGLRAHFGLPVLISVSRKSFLRSITGRGVDESGAATLAAELYAAHQGADFIRTHDVGALRDGLSVWSALQE